eukprot:523263_1
MAQAAEIMSLLKTDDKGFNTTLFVNKNNALLCESCNLVCCDAVELGCDHDDDDDICSYCNVCLKALIKNNNQNCPINNHKSPIIFPLRSVRRQIWKASVICPYSKQYIQMNNNNNKEIIDTNCNDEKEGIVPNQNNNNNIINGCDFKGNLKE